MTNDFLPKPLVSAEWLLKHREQVLLFDCRFSLTDNQAGIEAYRAGHVPGAIFADLAQHLSSIAQESGTGGRHPAPEPVAGNAQPTDYPTEFPNERPHVGNPRYQPDAGPG